MKEPDMKYKSRTFSAVIDLLHFGPEIYIWETIIEPLPRCFINYFLGGTPVLMILRFQEE